MRPGRWARVRGALGIATLLAVACHSSPAVPADGPFALSGELADPLARIQAPALVLLFVGIDCPISNRYAPEVNRIYAEYSAQDVEMRLVYSEGSSAEIQEHLRDYRYSAPALRDPNLVLAERCGASVTPEAVVFGLDGRIAYRGRIDDWYVDFGKARHSASTSELRDALDAVLGGSPVAVPEAPAVGCFLPKPTDS